MARTNVYGERRLVHIAANDGNIRYGFKTAIDQTEGAELGHMDINPATPPDNLVIGAEYPRPTKMRKASNGVSSFCSFERLGTANAAGWRKVKPPKLFPFPSGINLGITAGQPDSVVCYVTIRGVNWAWRMPGAQYGLISGDLSGLGVTASENISLADQKRLASNVGKKGFPVPGRAKKTVANGDTYSTYFGVAQLPTGWVLASPPILTLV